MSFRHLYRYGRSLSPATAAAKAGRYLERRIGAWLRGRRNAGRSTFPPDTDFSALAPAPTGLDSVAPALVDSDLPRLEQIADRYMAHRFDLLGSGWVEVRHGMSAAGFEGHRFPAHEAADAETVVARLSPGNRAPADAIRAGLSADYEPIDWQLDFRSGYRWREDRWSAGISYGHEPGVDVKLPWELARLQHLPQIALAARFGAPDKRLARRLECRDQIIDFISVNPPGYGVNWHCTMDVAIRAANMAMTHWLLGADAADMEKSFARQLAATLLAHGRHIMANLEDHGGFRGNHYLADIAGLAFTAAALDPTDETREWWRFATSELIAEATKQFHADGGNFEGSTSYHRLSAEMVAWTVALILGRDGGDGLPDDIGTRLYRMARFAEDVTKPDGHVVQIGDNDSGRFFKLGASDIGIGNGFGDDLVADHLDHGALIATIGALLGNDVGADGRFAVEHTAALALAGGRRLDFDATPVRMKIAAKTTFASGSLPGTPMGAEVVIALPEGALDDVATAAYPEFGLYIWKSRRLFLSVRCGLLGQLGRGGHDHNDQLAIELQVDGKDWLADPGSYVYTADPKLRDAYRSVMAHAGPRLGAREPGGLDLGMFILQDRARAECLHFDIAGVEGRHFGFMPAVYRALRLESGTIHIRDSRGGRVDWAEAREIVRLASAEDCRRHFDIRVPFSPGYGIREKS